MTWTWKKKSTWRLKMHFTLQQYYRMRKEKLSLKSGRKKVKLLICRDFRHNLPSHSHCGIIMALQSVVGRQKQQRGICLLPESAYIHSDMTVYEKSASSDRQTKWCWDQRKTMQIKKHLYCQGEICLTWDSTEMKSMSDFRIAAHSELDKRGTHLRVKLYGETSRVAMKGQLQAWSSMCVCSWDHWR